MNIYTRYLLFFVATFILNPFNQDKQVKISSSNPNKAIYSGFLQSQNRAIVSENIILSCKFKSMNRKSAKSRKLKDKIEKGKI
tara:strand:- start:221 stop:469 length:249 start_codon:yes stop_codon:yes gene_type:complete